MSLYSNVYPRELPGKFQMEALFNTLDRFNAALITDAAVKLFGLKKWQDGKYEITTPTDKARRHFPAFYNSLPVGARVLFQIGFLNSAEDYLQMLLDNITDESGDALLEERESLRVWRQHLTSKLAAYVRA